MLSSKIDEVYEKVISAENDRSAQIEKVVHIEKQLSDTNEKLKKSDYERELWL